MRASTAIIAVAAGLTAPANAQADFSENFENLGSSQVGQGPDVLVGAGWIFRNQSSPSEVPAYHAGNGFGGGPFDGNGYLATDSLAATFDGGQLATWAILPDIDGQIAGDLLTIWVSGGGSISAQTYLDLLYSPDGSTDSGSGPGDTGSFTQTLWSQELPIAAGGYQRVTVELPGDGRIAMRFRSPSITTFFGNGAFLSLDTLTVGPAGSDPCGVPLPDAGETVVWSAAGGPYQICQDLLIPPGARVEIEPGTTVDFSGGTLRVQGELVASGTPAEPVQIRNASGFSPSIELSGSGRLDLSEAVVTNARLHVLTEDIVLALHGVTLAESSRITGVGGLFLVEGCTFDNASFGFAGQAAGIIRLVDTDFINGASASLAGMLLIDGVTIDGGGLSIAGTTVSHPILLDNLTIVNNTADAGIKFYGPNFLIGPNVTLQNNRYPIAMSPFGAGLLPGSTLPQTGNLNNYISVDQMQLGFHRVWANTGLPYVIDGFPQNYGGSLRVEPGTNLKFRPGAGAFLILDADLQLEGTKEEPILLEAFSPAAGWFGLKWVDDFDATVRHAIFDNAEIAVQSDGGVLDLFDTTIRNSDMATGSSTGGIVRLFNSRIVDNLIGMSTTQSGRIEADGRIAPSIFEGNATAIEYNNANGTTPYLRFNWWAHATGPNSVLWPSGQGDFVDGVHPAAFNPFLTEPPDLSDDAPVVEMMPLYFTAQTGDTLILRWSSSDDIGIDRHLVQFADADFPSRYVTVAELPGDASTYEFTVPLVTPTNLYTTPSAIRIVAVDTAGQESFDKSVVRVPYQEDWTVIEQTVTNPGTVRPHDTVDVCWTPGGNADVYLLMDGIAVSDSNGGSNGGCLAIGAQLPYSSTDTARFLVLTTFGAGGRIAYSFSDYFSIRPPTEFGDQPPVISVISPAPGSTFSGGGAVPIEWSATDDESMRSFHIQGSYDGGRTWHFIARDLPGDARSFTWDLPESNGIPDVRVRVVGFDHRFQDSSNTTAAFAITPGSACPPDLTGDGNLDFFDVTAFLTAFNNRDPSADLSSPFGQFDFFDVSAYLTLFNLGCP